MSIFYEKVNQTSEVSFTKTTPNILNSPNLGNVREKETNRNERSERSLGGRSVLREMKDS